MLTLQTLYLSACLIIIWDCRFHGLSFVSSRRYLSVGWRSHCLNKLPFRLIGLLYHIISPFSSLKWAHLCVYLHAFYFCGRLHKTDGIVTYRKNRLNLLCKNGHFERNYTNFKILSFFRHPLECPYSNYWIKFMTKKR